MSGLHCLADFIACAPQAAGLRDAAALRSLCLHAAQSAGLHVVGEVFHAFGARSEAGNGSAAAPELAQSGVTGVLVLAESHLAVHTWPERGLVTIDLYVCNLRESADHRAEAALAVLREGLQPQEVALQRVRRAV